jgi:hypothetical protein
LIFAGFLQKAGLGSDSEAADGQPGRRRCGSASLGRDPLIGIEPVSLLRFDE